MNNKKARVIAFYLPQFHPIPENDAVWGKGFTEWTNVAKAKPLFKGHYQPRIPADLGFYDLRLPIIREQQAEMAREAGVEGFMYWHYWFGNGKMLLEKPFEEVLASGKPDFPFCLGWANHDWTTKSWSKESGFSVKFRSEFIAKMEYPGKEDDIAHFNYCLPAFKDKRYVCVDGKPFFYIWAPDKHPHLKEFIQLWNNLAIENGLKGIHFVANVNSKNSNYDKYKQLGFSAVNYNTMTLAQTAVIGSPILRRLQSLFSWYIPGVKLNKYDYNKIAKNMASPLDCNEDCYPTILPGYDRTARSGRAAVIYDNPNPEAFQEHVRRTVETIQNKEDEHKIIILKSWNEWAEGNYMEPDLKFGHGFLNALRDEIVKKED